MRIPAFLTSPLAGTAAVVTGLAVVAIPLHRLTSAPSVVRNPAVETGAVRELATPAVLRLKLLSPARTVSVGVPGGPPLLALDHLPAGDSEYDVEIPLDHGTCELEIAADLGGGTAETAVFLTIMPDGLEEKTVFITGVGALRDVFRIEWPHHHD